VEKLKFVHDVIAASEAHHLIADRSTRAGVPPQLQAGAAQGASQPRPGG